MVSEGQLECLKWVCGTKAKDIPLDLNARDISGWTPIHTAFVDGRLDVAEYLLTNEGILNYQLLYV